MEHTVSTGSEILPCTIDAGKSVSWAYGKAQREPVSIQISFIEKTNKKIDIITGGQRD
jgi:hypothetical protein